MKHRIYDKDGKFVSVRMCVACREHKPKQELIKVKRVSDGAEIDGKTGRGAYVCNRIECIEKAQKIRGLERGLKSAVDKKIYDELTELVTK